MNLLYKKAPLIFHERGMIQIKSKQEGKTELLAGFRLETGSFRFFSNFGRLNMEELPETVHTVFIIYFQRIHEHRTQRARQSSLLVLFEFF